MNSQEQQSQTSVESNDTQSSQPLGIPEEPDPSMGEYFRLQWELVAITAVLTIVIFVFTYVFYTFNTALNYLIGALAGILYLRLLAKHVEQLGRERRKLGQTRLATFVVLILVASQLDQLEILPIFLGFLTYKASLIIYVLRTTLMPSSS
ncbi:MAG: ATP synthase subunit I [Leptolyngbyaceae bacterium]|nr:ATP synthase subunit I [Leptolyngbyaceae bacterium]